MTWVVLANSNQCKIYNYHTKLTDLTLIKEMNDAKVRQKKSEALTTEKPGKMTHGQYVPHTDAKEVEIEHFIHAISKELEHGRVTNQYQNLIVFAPSKIEGLLFRHLNKHTLSLTTKVIQKDCVNMELPEIKKYLKSK